MERALKTRRRLKIPRQREKGNRVAPEIYCTPGINTRVAATRRINTRAYKSFKSAKPVCSSFGRGYYHRRSLCARQTHKPIAIESLFDCAVGLFDVRLKRSNVFSRRDAVSTGRVFTAVYLLASGTCARLRRTPTRGAESRVRRTCPRHADNHSFTNQPVAHESQVTRQHFGHRVYFVSPDVCIPSVFVSTTSGPVLSRLSCE